MRITEYPQTFGEFQSLLDQIEGSGGFLIGSAHLIEMGILGQIEELREQEVSISQQIREAIGKDLARDTITKKYLSMPYMFTDKPDYDPAVGIVRKVEVLYASRGVEMNKEVEKVVHDLEEAHKVYCCAGCPLHKELSRYLNEHITAADKIETALNVVSPVFLLTAGTCASIKTWGMELANISSFNVSLINGTVALSGPASEVFGFLVWGAASGAIIIDLARMGLHISKLRAARPPLRGLGRYRAVVNIVRPILSLSATAMVVYAMGTAGAAIPVAATVSGVMLANFILSVSREVPYDIGFVQAHRASWRRFIGSFKKSNLRMNKLFIDGIITILGIGAICGAASTLGTEGEVALHSISGSVKAVFGLAFGGLSARLLAEKVVNKANRIKAVAKAKKAASWLVGKVRGWFGRRRRIAPSHANPNDGASNEGVVRPDTTELRRRHHASSTDTNADSSSSDHSVEHPTVPDTGRGGAMERRQVRQSSASSDSSGEHRSADVGLGASRGHQPSHGRQVSAQGQRPPRRVTRRARGRRGRGGAKKR